MEIPPSLSKPDPSSVPLQGKRGLSEGEGREVLSQKPPSETSLGTPFRLKHYFQTVNRPLSREVLRELIYRIFLHYRTPLPSGQRYSVIEQFVAQAIPYQYVSRLAFARQWVEKGLPLTKEGLQKLYSLIEADSSTYATETKEAKDGVVPQENKAYVDDKEQQRGDNVTLLEEYNKRKSRRGQWILLPFRYSLENLSFVACLRVHLSSSDLSPTTLPDKIVLSVRRNHPKAKTWYFAWNLKSPEVSLSLYPPLDEPTLPEDLLERLRKKLRKIGLKLDDNKDKGIIFDGFDELMSIFQNIDEQV